MSPRGPDQRTALAVGDERVLTQDMGHADVGQPGEVGASHTRWRSASARLSVDAQPRPLRVGRKRAVDRLQHAVEEDAFGARVRVEVLAVGISQRIAHAVCAWIWGAQWAEENGDLVVRAQRAHGRAAR